MPSTTATLADLLAEPSLQLDCAVPEADLGRTVRWAQSTDLLDPSPYLRGGELVCTVGSGLIDQERIDRFVAAVDRVGSAGICFGVGDVVDVVPEGLISACRARGLPLLVAPRGLPFMAISEFLVERQARAAADERAHVQGLTSELLLALRSHRPLKELLAMTGDRLGGHVSLGYAEPATGDVAVVATVEDLTLTWSGPPPGPAPADLETVTRLLAVAHDERDVEEDLRRERVGELLSLVADQLASPMALASLLDAAGVPTDHVVFSVWPSGAGRLLRATIDHEKFALGETPDAAVLITSDSELPQRVADELSIPCGFSRAVPLRTASRALGEARAAGDLARRRGHNVGPNGLTTLEGLLAQQPPERLVPFVDVLLGPLLDADRQRNTGLVATLRSYLDNDCSLIATARADFLHVNTVRHRLDRIRELTERDPLRSVDRADLRIALWAMDHRRRS